MPPEVQAEVGEAQGETVAIVAQETLKTAKSVGGRIGDRLVGIGDAIDKGERLRAATQRGDAQAVEGVVAESADDARRQIQGAKEWAVQAKRAARHPVQAVRDAANAAVELGPDKTREIILDSTETTGEIAATAYGAGELLEGGLARLNGAIGRNSFTTVGDLRPPSLPDGIGGMTLDPPIPGVAVGGGSPAHLTAGQTWEQAQLTGLGKVKNTQVWRPTAEDIDGAAFKTIVGPAKYTRGGTPVGRIVDIAETGGNIEIKGGSKVLESSYQLRLQTYRALQSDTPLTIRTTRPANPTFSAWLDRWGVTVEKPSTTAGAP